MSKEGVDTGRRRFLTLTTSAVGAVGAGLWAVPFVASLPPSEKAKALGAPVAVDISKLEPGQQLTVAWRSQAVFIVKRTNDMLATLKEVTDRLADANSDAPQQPEYAKNETRSIKPEILVIKGVCTHLGCSPKFRPDKAPPDIGADWQGGFYCPCHGSKFDFAGRVYAGVPAPTNIIVPPHHYRDENTVVIGEDQPEKKEVA